MKLRNKFLHGIGFMLISPLWLIWLLFNAVISFFVCIGTLLAWAFGKKPSFKTSFDPETNANNPQGPTNPAVINNNIYAQMPQQQAPYQPPYSTSYPGPYYSPSPYAAYQREPQAPSSSTQIHNNSNSTVNNYYMLKQNIQRPNPPTQETNQNPVYGPTYVPNQYQNAQPQQIDSLYEKRLDQNGRIMIDTNERSAQIPGVSPVAQIPQEGSKDSSSNPFDDGKGGGYQE